MINKYNKMYNDILNRNIDNIIESFVKYYGEEYRDKITYRLNNVIFCWFNHRFLIDLYEKYGNEIKNKADIEYFLKLEKNEIIGSNISDKAFLYIKNNIKDIINISEYALALNITLSISKEFFEVVAFPLFLSTDKLLFHEINHIICSNKLSIVNDSVIVKDGLDIDRDKYSIIEEIVNDIASEDITDIFHLLNAKLFNLEYKIGNVYEIIYPFVLPFYNKYKEILKKIRITTNYNLLYKYINKDIYDDYVEFVTNKYYEYIECYNNNVNFIINESDIDKVNDFVNKMEIKDIKRLKLV